MLGNAVKAAVKFPLDFHILDFELFIRVEAKVVLVSEFRVLLGVINLKFLQRALVFL